MAIRIGDIIAVSTVRSVRLQADPDMDGANIRHMATRIRMRRLLSVTSVALSMGWTPLLAQQSPSRPAATPRPAPQPAAQQTTAKQSAWKPPMTSWGEPDLRGIWPLNHLISTPFQRPERFGERRLMTDENSPRRRRAPKPATSDFSRARFRRPTPVKRRGSPRSSSIHRTAGSPS
jgi:hypothetical protein